MCMRVHDVPQDFDYDPVRREMVDRSERPELMSASVEYVAPAEYTVGLMLVHFCDGGVRWRVERRGGNGDGRGG